MATTVWLDEPTRDALRALKEPFGVTSLGAVIRRLLEQPQETAQQIYARRKPEVDAACKKHRVRRLIAFGSRARGDAHPGSDLDVAIELPEDIGLGVVTALEDVAQAFGCPTDVIDYPPDRLRMRTNIERDGVVLYERR